MDSEFVYYDSLQLLVLISAMRKLQIKMILLGSSILVRIGQ